MVRFLPFDCTDEESINIVLQNIDFSIQYGEDLEFKEPKVKKQRKAKHTQIHLKISHYYLTSHFHPFLQEIEEEPANLNYDEIFQGKTES